MTSFFNTSGRQRILRGLDFESGFAGGYSTSFFQFGKGNALFSGDSGFAMTRIGFSTVGLAISAKIYFNIPDPTALLDDGGDARFVGNIAVTGTVDGVDVAALASASTDDQTAAEVPFTPYSAIAATDVQAAIQEVLDEIAGGSGAVAKTIDYTSLAANATPSTGDLVYVQADGIAGLFQYDSKLSTTDDGGVVKDGWVRQYTGALNAKWWGATGDGTTDDQPAISAALHFAYDNSLDIFFQKVIFYLPQKRTTMALKTHERMIVLASLLGFTEKKGLNSPPL